MDSQIKKGILEMCVLFIIHKKEIYGYDVMKTMKRYFPEVNDSTFYAILRRLHADGSTEIKLSAESNGPIRKYYKITNLGCEVLQNNIESWERISCIVKEIGI